MRINENKIDFFHIPAKISFEVTVFLTDILRLLSILSFLFFTSVFFICLFS